MTYIARINLEIPVGHEALRNVPGVTLQIEDVHRVEDEPEKFIFWARGDDFESFEAALSTDPTIATYTLLTEFPDRRLYRGVLSDESQDNSLYRTVVREDIIPIRVTVTAAGAEFLARFPSRDALFAFRDAAQELNRDFELLSIYEEKQMENDGGRGNRLGVTEAQREALLSALEHGYFSIPRRTTMEDMADDLGISTSALSSRLRRGQRALLRNTLAQGPVI